MSDVGKVTFSDSAQKQLQLIGGIVSAVLGIIINVTDLINKVPGLPPYTSWVLGGASILFGIWMLVKWRTRYSRLLKPDALRLDRDNAEHLVGRAEDINNLVQQCLAKQIVFLEGESGSGKSALVRAGLLTKLKDDKSVQPLLLDDWWVNDWERIPNRALKSALMTSGALGSDAKANLSALADVERELVRIHDEKMRTPLIIFDQFDDYQARNRRRFLPNKVWLDPATLRQSPFWDMVARLLEQDKLRCLFVTRSDTAGGLSSVSFFGSVPPMRLDRVRSSHIDELLTRLTEGTPTTPVIADPDAGWTKLRERIIRDISEQDVILPQQLKIVLAGIQSLKRLNPKQYERVGGVAGIEAFYVEQQINGTARKVGLAPSQVRALLVNLIDPLNPTKTRLCAKEDLLAVTAKASGQPVASDDLDNALEELEHAEMLRSSSDPESGRTTYRLDHDYLTRGVLTAERRADRWHYLLEDRAKAFQDASTLWKKWKALLPVGTQCRLAMARLRGQFSYGNRRSYVLWSLARLPVRMLGFVGSFVLVLLLLSVAFSWKMNSMARAGIDSFFKEIHGVTDSRQIHALTRSFKSEVLILVSQKSEEAHATAGRIIETMRSTSNSDQVSALQEALVDVTSDLKPEEVQTLGSSILREIQNTADTAQINALSRAFAAISLKLRPENAQALAELILHAIKGGGDPNQRHALGLGLSAISSQLKPEQVGTLDGSIVEAIQGGRTVCPSPDPN